VSRGRDPGAGDALLLVVAVPVADHERWLAGQLRHGAALGLAALLDGTWRAGITARPFADGAVAGETGGGLVGARLFACPPAAAAGLLDLLTVASVAAAGGAVPP
jgi:hypothetical protein